MNDIPVALEALTDREPDRRDVVADTLGDLMRSTAFDADTARLVVGHLVVIEDLEDAEGQAENGEDAQGAADLLALLRLYEPAVVGRFGEDLLEPRGQPVLVLEGEQQIVRRTVCREVLPPVGAAEDSDVPLQRGDAASEASGVSAGLDPACAAR